MADKVGHRFFVFSLGQVTGLDSIYTVKDAQTGRVSRFFVFPAPNRNPGWNAYPIHTHMQPVNTADGPFARTPLYCSSSLFFAR